MMLITDITMMLITDITMMLVTVITMMLITGITMMLITSTTVMLITSTTVMLITDITMMLITGIVAIQVVAVGTRRIVGFCGAGPIGCIRTAWNRAILCRIVGNGHPQWAAGLIGLALVQAALDDDRCADLGALRCCGQAGGRPSVQAGQVG